MGVAHSLSTLGFDHPKLDRLVDIVEGHREGRILVFTQYRDTVSKIMERLGNLGIPSHEFIGQSARDGEEGMTQKQQIKILGGFERGEYNVLVATSVAEEGLDIPKVDVVIFYEPIPSEIRSIQRRGRTGRSRAGEVFILMAKGTRDEGYFWSSFHREKKMEEILKDIKVGVEGRGRQKTLVEYTPAEENSGIKIYADVREKNSDIIRILKENAQVELRQLPVGDYILSDRVCVERKTVDDFLQSIIDSRLITQAKELSQNFDAPILMLEGDSMKIYVQRDIHPNAIRGMMSSLAIDFGVSIIPTQNSEDTARTLYVIAKREQEDERRTVSLRGERKPFTLAERQQFIVESLPNVSAILARRLLKHFGSVQDIMNASEKELMEVEGVGKKRADGIIKVAGKDYIP